MKKVFFSLFTLLIIISSCKPEIKPTKKPKLVVGIVIDQMRYDYLTKFMNRYGDNGFKRLLNGGFSLKNAHYNYIPTYTAVGHTSIYTGATPFSHGIISNNWYDKFLKETIYCVDDKNYKTIGNDGNYGQKSPYRLNTTTVADQLQLAQNKRGKTIGIAIKDRSAILPVGHTANGAYWYQGSKANQWVSSSFYMDNLPEWVTTFNKNGKADAYLSKPWKTLYDIKTYTKSRADNNEFEKPFNGNTNPVFPKDIPNIKSKNGNYSIISSIPAGNSFTADFAKAAIIGENLGKSETNTDFLAVSFSSTDYIGHRYGVAAVETEDTYLRLDKDLANFFSFLDREVGKGNYTLFLTADHAAVHVPSYLQSLKIPAHYIRTRKMRSYIDSLTLKHFNSDKLIENISNYQIFLDKKELEKLKLDKNIIAEKIVDEIVNYPEIYKAVSAKTLQTTNFTSGILNALQNGYNQKLSGDVMLIPLPATLGSGRKGTSHGSGYSYDTHVPIIFYGNGIQKGSSSKKYNITDIAPTISTLLDIEFPNGTTGKVIEEVLKN